MGIGRPDGTMCEDDQSIQQEAVRFYENLFAEEFTGDHESLLQYIPNELTEDDNDAFLEMP